MRAFLPWLALIAALATGSSTTYPAYAADPAVSPSARTRAAALEAEAKRAFDAGDFALAEARYTESYQLGKTTRAGLGVARSQARQLKLLRAETTCSELIKTLHTASSDNAGLAEVERERRDLAARIPRLRLRVQGARLDQVRLGLDGQSIESRVFEPSAMFPKGKTLRVDPGTHVLTGDYEGQHKSVDVRLPEGRTVDASLVFADPDTLKQRACRDRCIERCGNESRNSPCYLECKKDCFQATLPD
jgi:hypothetical protein